MRYLPKSPADREAMLKAIGIRSVDDLFAPIPAEYRLNRDLKIPRQMAESEIVDFFRQRSRENGDEYTSFLGAGAYFHYRPVIIDSLISRGEFLTAYTPYQAEISQGTLQSIFEFQTMICELTGMEVANASMYDGSTGAAEAVMMSVRLTGRRSVVVARSLHPELTNKNQQQMLAYREMPDEQLFSTQWVKVALPPEEFPGFKAERITCAECGEGINFRREVKRDGKTLCRACAGERY